MATPSSRPPLPVTTVTEADVAAAAAPTAPPAVAPTASAATPAVDQYVITSSGGPVTVPAGQTAATRADGVATMTANAPGIKQSLTKADTAVDQLETKLGAEASKTATAATEAVSAQETALQDDNAKKQELFSRLTNYVDSLNKYRNDDIAAAEADVKNARDAYLRNVAVFKDTRINNWWADASTPVKILGLISQALAGAANALAGNPSAETPLDKIINNDIKQQMANADLRKDNVSAAKGLFIDAQDAIKNLQLSWEATRQVAYSDVLRQTELMDKILTSPEQKAALAQFKLQVQERMQITNDKAANAVTSARMDEAKNQGATLLALNKQAMDAEVAAANIDHLDADTRKKLDELKGAGVDAFADVPGSAKLKDRVSPAVFTELGTNLTDFNELRALDYLYQNTKEEDVGKRRQLAAQILVTARRLAKTGAAMSDQEYKNIVLAFGADESWFSAAKPNLGALKLPPAEAIRTAAQNSESILRSKLSAYTSDTGQPLQLNLRPIAEEIKAQRVEVE